MHTAEGTGDWDATRIAAGDESTAFAGRREATDRRKRPTPMVSRYWLRGRRRSGGRRPGESQAVYVDRYTRVESVLFIWLALASASDLALTLLHLAQGGTEANPIMDWFLVRFGTPGFVAAKLGLTFSAGLFLLIHVRFRGTRTALWTLGAMYVAILGYHVVVAIDRGAFAL